MTQVAKPISKIHKIVSDGMFKAELDAFLQKELAEEGYAGLEVRVTPQRTEVIVQATRTQEVLGEKGRRIRELTALVLKRFALEEGKLELFAEKVLQRGLCAEAQAESLRYKLLGGLPVRRACYGVLKFIMESGAQGCELIVSGKLRGQRAKAMKFLDGLIIHAGEPADRYVKVAVRTVLLKQGMLGVKVKIMLPHDPEGKRGPKKQVPDKVQVFEPKAGSDQVPKEPYSELKEGPRQPPAGQLGAPGPMPQMGPGGAAAPLGQMGPPPSALPPQSAPAAPAHFMSMMGGVPGGMQHTLPPGQMPQQLPTMQQMPIGVQPGQQPPRY